MKAWTLFRDAAHPASFRQHAEPRATTRRSRFTSRACQPAAQALGETLMKQDVTIKCINTIKYLTLELVFHPKGIAQGAVTPPQRKPT